MHWQRIEKSDFGYAVHVPQGWDERPPDLKNSPWETARFGDPADRRHSMIVFRAPGRPAVTATEAAERAQTSLAATGFAEFEITETEVGGRPGARLDCALRDAGRVWAVREYFLVQGGARFVLGLGSAVPDEDDLLFTTIAERFEVLGEG